MAHETGISEYQSTIIHAEGRFGSQSPPGPPLQPPSGGGTSNGMEARVAKLEAHVQHILGDVSALKADMRDVRDRLPRIETRLDHLPGKGFIVTVVVATIALLGALITLQQQIQAWIGIAPHH